MLHHDWPIHREYSAERLNTIVNHPEVRPWVGAPGMGPLDMTGLVANPNNILLMGEAGGLFFIQDGPGRYEVHTQFMPSGRGEHALTVTRNALFWMFTQTDCEEIITKVPDGNKGALGLVRAIHGDRRFHRDNAWHGPDGITGVAFYALTIDQWAGKCTEVESSGEWFHDKLEAAKLAKGGTTEIHDHDEAHDRYVGATVEMILAGQIEKALGFYNRWARFAGYAEVAVIAANPWVFDIQDALIAVRENDFEVLLCR